MNRNIFPSKQISGYGTFDLPEPTIQFEQIH